MKLFSKDFKHGDMIPSKFTCDGDDISPQLAWDDVPPETQSFALTCLDPDAPMGTWVHWLVCDIPKNVHEIPQGSSPGKEIINDFKKTAYGGPCPPSGVHRYFFTIYALKVSKLDNPTKQNFVELCKKNALASAELMGKYKRA